MRIRMLNSYACLLFLLCTSLPSEAKITFATLKPTTKHTVITRIDSLKKTNHFFNTLYTELELSPKIFAVKIVMSNNLASFIPKPNGGTINFSTVTVLADDEAVFEEFFHAFQYLYYNLPMQLREGGSNIEFEAKLFRAILALNTQLPFAETPSQKGLLNFVLSLVDANGYFTRTHFSIQEQANYISCVQHFRNHWVKRNKQENTSNIYTQLVLDDWQPEALFYLIELSQ